MTPDFLNDINLTTWAGWVSLIIVILWTNKDDIKAGLSKWYGDRYADSADRRESDQTLQYTKLESDLQERATRAGMEWYERKAAIDILQDQLTHSRDDFSDLQRKQDQIKEILQGINSEIKRMDSRLDGFLMLLSRIEENTRK